MKKFPFEIILNWYQKNGRHWLPWREKQTPYHVWISEIFLKQTQVSRVINYFEKVTERFPDIESFAKTDYDTFFPYYEWLGYYSRARNMLKTAKIIQEEYAWVFPEDYNELIWLPGIWPYTAQAILAFWYNKNMLAFDTNIEKIFARYYFWSRFTKLSKEFKKEIQEQFETYCSIHSPVGRGLGWGQISGRAINAALMDFSSLLDINEKNNIDWNNYPLTKSVFFEKQWSDEHKPEKKWIKIDKKDAQILVFIHQDHKEYYSSDPDNFKPFLLEKTSLDHRHYIKDYFKTNFWLSLSVRPAYKKIASKEWNYFYYHAQIQAGEHDFWVFGKKEKEEWEE